MTVLYEQVAPRFPKILMYPFTESERSLILSHVRKVKQKIEIGTFRFTTDNAKNNIENILKTRLKTSSQLMYVHLMYLTHWNIKHGNRRFKSDISKAWDVYFELKKNAFSEKIKLAMKPSENEYKLHKLAKDGLLVKEVEDDKE